MAAMEEDPDLLFHHPIIVTLDPFTYGARAGEKIHVKTICYSLLGPIVNFPGKVPTDGCNSSESAEEGSEQQTKKEHPGLPPLCGDGKVTTAEKYALPLESSDTCGGVGSP